VVPGSFKELPLGAIPAKIGVILLLALGLSFPQLLDRVVANVNGEPILESELKVARIFYGVVDRRELINMLVEKHLLAQFLAEKGMNVPDAYIDQVVREIAQSNGKSLEELYEDLRREGLTPEDLRNFLRVEITATLGLREYLRNRIEVSEIEVELERLRKGEVDYLREIELLVIPAGRKEEVLGAVSQKGPDLQKIAKALNLKTEKLRVKRGELVEPLDREVWRTPKGELAVAEDGENLYLARVLREVRVFSGRSEEEIREEILRRKLEREREEIVRRLMRERFVEIHG